MGYSKFATLKQQYLLSADNELTYSRAISNLTKKDVLSLYLCQND